MLFETKRKAQLKRLIKYFLRNQFVKYSTPNVKENLLSITVKL